MIRRTASATVLLLATVLAVAPPTLAQTRFLLRPDGDRVVEEAIRADMP